MKRLFLTLLFAAFAFSASAQSTVHAITDPVQANVTHCGFQLDAAAVVVVPVTPAASIPAPNTPPAGTQVCYQDITSTPGGAHTLKANTQVIDPNGLFPPGISAFGNTVNFTVPTVPGAPTTDRLVKP